MTVQTPVLLASTSKSLTAIAVMQQVEAADPAAPSVPEEALPLLLEHQGEWGNSHTYLGWCRPRGWAWRW
jgi:CubicO group peptidase (beta-lactamase class C family)